MTLRIHPAVRALTLASTCALLLGAAPKADAANTRYAQDTIIVRLQFDGDPGFPSLTSFRNTAGLARFTGSAFGLNEAQRNEVVAIITQRLRERYAAFNVEFVTRASEAPTLHFTWGIDDSWYTFPNTNVSAEACLTTIPRARLLGKAIGGRRITDVACDGTPIHHPRHARTFAGSFAMTGQDGVQSAPALRLGNLLPGDVPVTVAHIARALANSATHEIGHLFGLEHPDCSDLACQRDAVMHAADERIEATFDKTFKDLYGDIANLNRSLGPRIRLTLRNRGLLHDPGSGVMFMQDANQPAPTATAAYADAGTYASTLDRLGYDDWRLPAAANPDGTSTCSMRLGGVITVRLCDKSDLGRLFHRLLPWESPAPVDPAHVTRPYWAQGADGLPWVVKRNTQEQYPAGTVASAGVWPVRDGARLVDNGDGTITDTRRQLMWLRQVDVSQRFEWVQAGGRLAVGRYTDWRAPRLDELQDYTCEEPARDLRAARRDCRRSEMGHLFHGWGISSARPAPFTGLPPPLSDEDFWLANPIPGEPNLGLAFSMRTGQIRALPRTTRLPVMWVRDAPDVVPAGRAVTVDPDPAVTVRFERVTQAGTLKASSTTAIRSFGRFGPGVPLAWIERTWTFQQGLSYARGDRHVRVCVRYELNELGPYGSIGLWGPITTSTGTDTGRMPAVPGYPDQQNQVMCAWAPYLGPVSVQRSLL